MSSSQWACALALSLFYFCAGWNKLFNGQRRIEMVRTMRRFFPHYNRQLYWFVTLHEVIAPIVLIVAMATGFRLGVFWWSMVLFIISLVAMVLHGWSEVKKWEPVNVLDWISCTLYQPEALYVVLCLGVML